MTDKRAHTHTHTHRSKQTNKDKASDSMASRLNMFIKSSLLIGAENINSHKIVKTQKVELSSKMNHLNPKQPLGNFLFSSVYLFKTRPISSVCYSDFIYVVSAEM